MENILSSTNLKLDVFTMLFCSSLAFQIAVNFNVQLHFFKTDPVQIYGNPQKLLGFFQLPALNTNQFLMVGIALVMSLCLAVVGILPVLMLVIALACNLLYFSSIQPLAFIQRKTNLTAIVLLILIFSTSFKPFLATQHTNWTMLLVKIAISQLYLSSGFQKLVHSGLKWAKGDYIKAYLVDHYLWGDRRMALIIARNPMLCSIISSTTLIFELTFWLIIICPSLTAIYVSLAFIFHLGTLLTMRINYIKYLIPVFMVFFTDELISLLRYLKS